MCALIFLSVDLYHYETGIIQILFMRLVFYLMKYFLYYSKNSQILSTSNPDVKKQLQRDHKSNHNFSLMCSKQGLNPQQQQNFLSLSHNGSMCIFQMKLYYLLTNLLKALFIRTQNWI